MSLVYEMPMTIMFDLDGTFAADLKAMREVVAVFKRYGHTLVMITAREDNEDNRMLAEQLKITQLMPILFAGRRPKRKVAREAGYEVDIWIEDNPVLVDFGVAGLEMVGEQH